jgi:hypothetical protein
VNYRYQLPEHLRKQASSFAEFANGAAQCHARLRNGAVVSGLLVSGGIAIAAMRGATELPFSVSEIALLFQAGDDMSPTQRSGWTFFDEWA